MSINMDERETSVSVAAAAAAAALRVGRGSTLISHPAGLE